MYTMRNLNIKSAYIFLIDIFVKVDMELGKLLKLDHELAWISGKMC